MKCKALPVRQPLYLWVSWDYSRETSVNPRGWNRVTHFDLGRRGFVDPAPTTTQMDRGSKASIGATVSPGQSYIYDAPGRRSVIQQRGRQHAGILRVASHDPTAERSAQAFVPLYVRV
jgi:hypothetical protein